MDRYDQGYSDALSDVLKLCCERRKLAESFNMKEVTDCWKRLESALSGQFEYKKEVKHEQKD